MNAADAKALAEKCPELLLDKLPLHHHVFYLTSGNVAVLAVVAGGLPHTPLEFGFYYLTRARPTNRNNYKFIRDTPHAAIAAKLAHGGSVLGGVGTTVERYIKQVVPNYRSAGPYVGRGADRAVRDKALRTWRQQPFPTWGRLLQVNARNKRNYEIDAV